MFSDFKGLVVTEIQVNLAPTWYYGRCRAYAHVVLNGAVRVNLRVVETGNRLIVAFPSRRRSDGTHYDLAHPISTPARMWLENLVLRAFAVEQRRYATDAEWRDALDDGLIEPPPSSCGHPTEQAMFERAEELAAI